MSAETIPVEPQHGQWCVAGMRRAGWSTDATHCLCLAECCVRLRRDGELYQCICPACDGKCGAHLDNGSSEIAVFLICLVAAFAIGFAILRGAW
jgi:hypothetical protein